MDHFSICVTVGNVELPFDRLFRLLKAMDHEGVSGTIQHGPADISSLSSNHFSKSAFLANDTLEHAFNQSDIIIAHAGIGTIMLADKCKKPLVLVPRLEKFNEHYDDHQLQICAYLKGRDGIAIYQQDDPVEFCEVVKSMVRKPPKAPLVSGTKLKLFLKDYCGVN